MADYTITSYSLYSLTSGTSFDQTSVNVVGGFDISDGEADSTFDSGDVLFSDFSYLGTFQVTDGPSGDVYDAVVSLDSDMNTLFVVAPSPYSFNDATDLPTTIDTATLDTSPFTVCFGAGTRIETPAGEVAVETLKIGDTVSTVTAGKDAPGTARVKWIGRRVVSSRFGPAERLRPVQFAAGSLGHGVPHSDLVVTADHAMLIGGVLCHAGALVNGTTITQVRAAAPDDRYVVYHIETDAHELILANGAETETFIDNVSRTAFDNFAEFEALYGDVPEMAELPFPRATTARQVPARIQACVRARLWDMM